MGQRARFERSELSLSRNEPPRLSRDGRMQLRVRGRCHGVLLCAGRVEACWGEFARAFEVEASAGAVTVTALGLLGMRTLRVALEPRAELREPRVQLLPRARVCVARRAPRASIAAPRLAGVGAHLALPSPARCTQAVPRSARLALRLPALVLPQHALARSLPRPGDTR